MITSIGNYQFFLVKFATCCFVFVSKSTLEAIFQFSFCFIILLKSIQILFSFFFVALLLYIETFPVLKRQWRLLERRELVEWWISRIKMQTTILKWMLERAMKSSQARRTKRESFALDAAPPGRFNNRSITIQRRVTSANDHHPSSRTAICFPGTRVIDKRDPPKTRKPLHAGKVEVTSRGKPRYWRSCVATPWNIVLAPLLSSTFWTNFFPSSCPLVSCLLQKLLF